MQAVGSSGLDLGGPVSQVCSSDCPAECGSSSRCLPPGLCSPVLCLHLAWGCSASGTFWWPSGVGAPVVTAPFPVPCVCLVPRALHAVLLTSLRIGWHNGSAGFSA